MSRAPLLSARGLVKRYAAAGPAVLDGLDLDIAAGEIVAVIGRSGSGKSTLLNLVGHMDAPDSGSLAVGGVDSSDWDDDRRTAFRRSQLGFVFQSYNLLPTLTVAENVALPLELNGIEDDARCARLLGRLGLVALGDRYPDQLSGGEQQRTAIARALIHRPALIVADEPTGNLDEDTGQQVVDVFEQAVREAGAALLMATHSLEMIGQADRVLELHHGRLQDHQR